MGRFYYYCSTFSLSQSGKLDLHHPGNKNIIISFIEIQEQEEKDWDGKFPLTPLYPIFLSFFSVSLIFCFHPIFFLSQSWDIFFVLQYFIFSTFLIVAQGCCRQGDIADFIPRAEFLVRYELFTLFFFSFGGWINMSKYDRWKDVWFVDLV